MMLTTTEQRVLNMINADALTATLRRLIAVPSVGGTRAEWVVQEVAADELSRHGLQVETWPIDVEELTHHPQFPGAEVARDQALGLTATLPGTNDGPSLLFNGHLDVVPVGDPTLWRCDPWEGAVAAGRVYGRGACDMKGGVAAAIHALGAIARSGVRLRGPLHMQTVIGEEDGGLGAFAASLRGPRCDAAIIAEPTELRPILAQAGALTFRLRVQGRAAARLEGYNALDAYLPLHRALLELEAQRNHEVAHPLMRQLPLPYPISIGVVRAGEWSSTVPEELVVEGRYGLVVGEAIEDARAALAQAVMATAAADPWLAEHPPVVEWWGGQFDYALIDGDHPVVATVTQTLATLGLPTAPTGVSWGSDMRLLQHIGGIPALLWGPGDVRLAHQRDESIPVNELVQAARLYALTALRFVGVA
jgi:acetylornithine deacetylase